MTSNVRRETADYIASMCKQLAKMADEHGFKVGATLLTMSQIQFEEEMHTLMQKACSSDS
jgi:hypothetical protein